MSGRWWRAYSRARHDPKLLKLSDRAFRWWFNLVCTAADNDGVLPCHADLAVEFRVSAATMTKVLDEIIAAGLLDHDETGIHPHNWNALQYKSDVSNERVKRFRERQRNGGCNVSETPSESETESEADTEKKVKDHSVANAPQMPSKRGCRLTDDWALTDDLRAFASNLNLNPDAERDAFVDYWTSVPGSRGLKLDWGKTFKNRCRELASRGGAKAVVNETWNERRIREGMAVIMGGQK